jgi:lysophospholipase L1-like esterase
MLLSVPGGTSTFGLPETVTVPNVFGIRGIIKGRGGGMETYRKARWAAFLTVLAVLLVAPQGIYSQRGTAADAFALKDGDRVVFYGDSITEQRLYTTYVEHYVLTHYPERRITFINTGWGGDKVTGNDCQPCAGVGGLARLKRDVIDYRPTVVTLLFGMNDGKYEDFNPATLKVYEDGLTAIIRELKAHTRARIFVMTPSAYDPTRHTPWSHTDRYNEVLARYGEAAKRIAAREGLKAIDLHTATTEVLSRAKAIDPNYTFAPDGVHPEADGQLVMAAEILRAWGAPVKGVEIKRQATLDADGVARLSISVPLYWPVPLPSETLLRASPDITELGRINLKVSGLPAGNYMVFLADLDAVDYTAKELQDGIALKLMPARHVEAAKTLAILIRQRADLFFTRWRQVEVPFAGHFRQTRAAVFSLDSLINELGARERALAHPHQYQIVVRRIP